MRRYSLSNKAIFAIVIIVLPVFLIFLYTFHKTEDYLKKHTLKDLAAVTDVYEGQVYQFIEMAKIQAVDFTSDGYIKEKLEGVAGKRRYTEGDLNGHLTKNKIILNRALYRIDLISLDGQVVDSTDGSILGEDLSDEDFFINGNETPSVTEAMVRPADLPALIITAPVLKPLGGKKIGFIVNYILLSDIDRILSGKFKKEIETASASGETGPGSMKVYIVNRDKRVIGSSAAGEKERFDRLIDTLPVRNCLSSNTETAGFYRNHLGEDVAGASACLGRLKWTLITEINEGEALSASRAVLKAALITVVAILGLMAALYMAFLRIVVGPVKKISRAAKDIAGGNYNIDIRINASDEIRDLSESFKSMAREIEERNTALRKSEDRLKKAQQIARIGSWELDIPRNKAVWSDELYRIFGIGAQGSAITFDFFLSLIHDDDRESARRSVQEALENKKPYSMDFRILRPDGAERVLHAETEVVFGDDGKPLSMAGTVQDITERRRIEETQERLTAVVEATTDLVAVGDVGGLVFYCNRAGREMLGIGADEDISVIRIPDAHPEWAARVVLGEGIPAAIRDGVWRGETAFLRRDGLEIPASQVILSHKAADGKIKFLSTIARDITESRKAGEAVKKNAAEVDSLNRALHGLTMKLTLVEEKERKRFAEMIHEGIGQNLVAVKLAYQHCLKGCRCESDELKVKMSRILNLLDETIKISRAMTADLYPAPLKDMGLFNAVKWHVESILRPSGIEVFLDIDGEVETLTEKVKQVIFSIIREGLQNISKYASATEVEVTCRRQNGVMRLVVRDNGAGFSQDGIRTKPGCGFGLVLMKEWAKSVQGELSINSAPGKGTAVVFEFQPAGEINRE